MANGIRSVSQTVQEREIVKTAPDIVVYFDGLPYLINRFLSDQATSNPFVLVNFNDHVSSFNAGYDTDLMVPSANIQLQVPNYQRYLYQMPGGNNLIATMTQVQVYAKGYYMSSQGDTVYRRVFKGMVSHVGYNDNGKTLEISIQCYGSLQMLELMQINLNPSVNMSVHTASQLTTNETIFGDHNPYRVIADAFTYGLQSDGFQLDSLFQTSPSETHNMFAQSVQRGYIAKWQAILFNMAKDVHVYGAIYKDNPRVKADKIEEQTAKRSPVRTKPDKNTLAAAPVRSSPVSEADDVANNTFYAKIAGFHPFSTITGLNITNNNIVNRLELIRRMVNVIGFEAYQDVDGKIIVKPPLYNLDVLNLGTRTKQTSTIPPFGSSNSQQNPLTAVYPQSNPFVVQLSEILTEQETEDQAAIRRTRTVVCGALDPKLVQVDLQTAIKTTAEYIDISKLQKFGLREEQAYMIPWLSIDDRESLFATAILDTVRANRAYRTYTVSIPMRPELKLGFPMFFPHKDMYGYIKSINVQYQVGGTATMTVTCDSLRRRVLVNTPQKTNDNPPKEYNAWVSAPNLVYTWSSNPPSPSQTQLNQSPNTSVGFGVSSVEQSATGGAKPKQSGGNYTDLVGTPASLFNVNPDTQPSPQQITVTAYYTQKMGSKVGSQTDTSFANWIIANDANSAQGTIQSSNGAQPGQGYFTQQRAVDYYYLRDIRGNAKTAVIPFTDNKGYEVIAPFPWGRYNDLNSAIREFTEMGWVSDYIDAQGNLVSQIQNLQDLAILQATDAFIFAGLGTPTATGDAVSKLSTALQAQQSLVGGNWSANNATNTQQNTVQSNQTMDATVIVLKYDGTSANDSQLFNQPQPEDSLVQSLIQQTQTSIQQVVDVLVSGGVAPAVGIQEALISTKTQTPTKLVSLNPAPPKAGS
jgi:hypothetical protein